MSKAKTASEEQYDIRQVIELTGLSEFTLRGWETRYSAVTPHRTETGRRRYSKYDLLKIQALRQLVNQGHKINAIAKLSLSELEARLADRDLSSTDPVPADIEKLILLADRFDWEKVKSILDKNLSMRTGAAYIHEFLIPLIGVINQQVSSERWSITQEHILSALIKDHLYLIKSTAPKSTNKKMRIVFATPEGDFHEIGLLMASTLASLHGAQNLYLGPNVPKSDLCEAVLKYSATHLVLAATVSQKEGSKDDIPNLISFIDRQLSSQVSLIVAGTAFRDFEFQLKRPFKKMLTMKSFESIFDAK